MGRLMDEWDNPTAEKKSVRSDVKKVTRGRKKIEEIKPVTIMLQENDITYCKFRAKAISKDLPNINSASAFIRMLIEEDRKKHPKVAEKIKQLNALAEEYGL